MMNDHPYSDPVSIKSHVLRSIWTLPIVLLSAIGVILVSTAYVIPRTPATHAATSVTLPIEVIGYNDPVTKANGMNAQGKIVSIQVDITDPRGIDSLYLRGHNLTYHWDENAWMEGGTDAYTLQAQTSEGGSEMYDTKASWRVNGGTWQYISVDRSACLWPYSAYRCMTGPLATKYLELRTDATGSGTWQAGTNTIEFRFNGIGSESSGYRILGLDVLAGNTSRLGATTFEWEDPDTWTPPIGRDNATDIDAGEALWSQRNVLVDNFESGKPFVASCADCHARDGHDLKFFNFSNRSIIQRSVHHGLTNAEGEQIAAYIRSSRVDAQLPAGYTLEDAGRPWNPPYQPGPGLKDRPVELWAAGAGARCMLHDDADMAKFMFPAPSSKTLLDGITAVKGDPNYDPNLGIDCNAIAQQLTFDTDNVRRLERAHPDSLLEHVEVPKAVQWPDMNEWWPDIHPYDNPYLTQADVENTPFFTNYLALHQTAENNRSQITSDPLGTIGSDLNWSSRFKNPLESQLRQSPYDYKALYSVNQWALTKQWEIMHEHRFEDLGSVIRSDMQSVGADIRPFEWFWPGTGNLFNTSGHKVYKCCGYFDKGTHRAPDNRFYWGDIWYDVAIVLENGNHNGSGNNPIDFNYNNTHIKRTHSQWDMNQGVRGVQLYLIGNKVYNQPQNLGGAPNKEDGAYYTTQTKNTAPTRLWYFGSTDYMKSIPAALRNELMETSIEAYTESVEKYAPAEFYEETGNNGWPASSYTPRYLGDNNIPPKPDDSRQYPDFMYTILAWHDDTPGHDGSGGGKSWRLSLDPLVLDKFARWNETMYPNGDWERWFVSTSDQSIELQEGWNIISSPVVPDDASMEAVFAPLGSDVVLVKDEDGNSYIPEFGINTIGSWDNTEGYKVFVTSNQTLTLDGPTVDPSSSITLQQGWNLVPYYPSSTMSAEEAFASLGADLVVVKDYAGNAYLPEFNVNSLHSGSGEVRPGQGYQVYVTSEATLTYPDSKQSNALLAGSSSISSGAPGVAFSSTFVLETTSLDDGARLTAQTSDGLRVGSGIIDGKRALVRVWGDDPQTDAIDGAEEGARITLRLATSSDEKPLQVSGVRDILRDVPVNNLTYNNNAILHASVDGVPSEMTLERNYPNPVRSSTTIQYSVPERTSVQLEVFDVLGRRVATLIDEQKSPGEYSVRFDASELSSGPYFYRLEAAGSVISRKMVVVR